MTTAAPASEHGTAPPNRSRWFVPFALLVVIGIGAAITGVVVSGNDEASAASLSQIKSSCGEWMNSSQGDNQSDNQPDDQWCRAMFAWMSDQSGGSMMGSGSGMGSMMWQGSEQMNKACRDWVAQDRADLGTVGPQRCDDMVEWMNSHMSSRDGNWMMGND